MKTFTCLFIFLMLIPMVSRSQNYYHPLIGLVTAELAPGTYHYYDNGGPNEDYSGNIDGTGIAFYPIENCFLDWHFEYYNIETNQAFCNGECCDHLDASWLPACGDLFLNSTFCGTDNFTPIETHCHGEGINFHFTSDNSVELSGWDIVINVYESNPLNVLCVSDCEVAVPLECGDGGVNFQPGKGAPARLAEESFSCWSFGPCPGAINVYPECDNQTYPGPERIYSIHLDDPQDLSMSCGCIKDLFLVTIYGCELYTCDKAIHTGNEFTLEDVPPGDHYLIAEYDCGGNDVCSCDLQYVCSDPGGLNCDDASEVECGDVIFDGNYASTGGMNHENDYCGFNSHVWTGREMVYEFIATYTGDVTITLTGLTADLDLFILQDCDPTYCVKNSINENSNDESVTFHAQEGEHYFIVVDGYNFAESTYWLSIVCDGELDCSLEEPIECGDVIYSSNSIADDALNNEIDYCHQNIFGWTGRERIYSFHSEINQTITITLSDLDENLDLFLLDQCDGGACVAESEHSGTSDESITVQVEKNQWYYIVIDGWNGAYSTYRLELNCTPLMCTECGDCFTYSILNKGLTSKVACHPKYIDCGVTTYPSPDHSFQWTVDGVTKSTKYAPTLTLETGKKVKVCQVVKYLGTTQYRCCWDIQPKPGCAKPPLAHVELGGEWPYYDAVLNAGSSENGQRYSWDFGDGTGLQSSGSDSTAAHTYSAGGYKYCTYVENDFGISSYCKSFSPGAIECTASPNPKFTYTLTGKTMTLKDVDNSASLINSYKIDFGDSTSLIQGNNWGVKTHTFAKDSTYEICIRFTTQYQQGFATCGNEGCVCFTVKVNCCQQTIDQCYEMKPVFLSTNGGLEYNIVYDAPGIEVINWEIDDTPVANSTSNTLHCVFPGEGTYNVCCYYRNPSNGCYIRCCKRIYAGNPFTCDFITYKYIPEQNGYQFELNRTMSESDEIFWSVDSPGSQELGTNLTSNILNIPSGSCQEYIISVRFYDKTCSCYRLCCLRFYLCDPDLCENLIKIEFLPNGKTRFYVDDPLEDMNWYSNDQVVGTGSSVSLNTVGSVHVCVQYFDPASQCHRECCRSFTTATADLAILDEAMIYPNPASDELNIILSFLSPTDVEVDLINEVGVVVRSIPASHQAVTHYTQRLELGDLPAGLYFVRVRTGAGDYTQRIIHL